MAHPIHHQHPATESTTDSATIDNPRCKSFGAGHRVHWVQGMRSNRDTEPGRFEPCEVIEASDDGWFTLVLTETGEERRLWNHDPDEVHELIGRKCLEINLRWSVLHQRQSSGGSTRYLSVRPVQSPCVFEEPSGPLHEQLLTHGGFSISGPEALRLLAEQAEDGGTR